MIQKLKLSGCDRGPFMTSLFAQRLCSLGKLIDEKSIPECERVLDSRDRRKIEAMLESVNGVGPKVLRNFFVLRDIPAQCLKDIASRDAGRCHIKGVTGSSRSA